MNFTTLWPNIAALTVSPVELVLRGTAMFWFLFLVFRFVVRRDTGAMGVTDFLFIALIGDASQNAMIGTGTSVADGIVLISTLVFWNFSVDYLGYRFAWFDRLVSAKKLCLVRDGRMIRPNMRRQFITADELEAKAREAGIDTIGKVKLMYLEADGEISVIPR